jgi:hypothetical protein
MDVLTRFKLDDMNVSHSPADSKLDLHVSNHVDDEIEKGVKVVCLVDQPLDAHAR